MTDALPHTSTTYLKFLEVPFIWLRNRVVYIVNVRGLFGTWHAYNIGEDFKLTPIARHMAASTHRDLFIFADENVVITGSTWLEVFGAHRLGHPDARKALCLTGGGITDIYFNDPYIFLSDFNGFTVLKLLGPRESVFENDADLVEHDIPPQSEPGSRFDVDVTLTNSGTCPWTGEGAYKLAVLQDSGELVDLNFSRINIPNGVRVDPGESYTFRFPLRIPGVALISSISAWSRNSRNFSVSAYGLKSSSTV